MRIKNIGFAFLLVALMFAFTVDANATKIGRRTFGKSTKASSSKTKKPGAPGKEKAFKDLIKDHVAIEGLFTFYYDSVKNTYLMSVNPEQIGPYYLMSTGRAAGDGTYYDTGPIGTYFPFYIKKVGKNLLFMEKNLLVRADSGNVANKAIAKGISDHLYASTPIKSKPQDSTKAVLIDPSGLFIRDAEFSSYYLGKARLGISFDKKNSYYESVKAFPENCEIDVKLHFRGNHPRFTQTLQSGNSFYHTYHFSLSSIPESDYVPRLGDERVGYFQTIYNDYSEMDRESAYIRYIDRWHLKKKNPDARMSEPETPIVYWIENSVPEEYRDAFAEGIEFWNPCFEELGIRNAVQAKVMPDTADWDPLDVRYSTVRWMVAPGRTYAIGPHRANPFTGQIYDADISVSSDFIRAMFNTMENLINPVIGFDGQIIEDEADFEPTHKHNDRVCTMAKDMAADAAMGLSYLLSSAGTFADKDSLTKEYVHAYIVELVSHEVGHTLGFRHNFKASTIYSLEQLQDREFTKKNSTVGTVMEYAPANIALKGQPQGEFYASVPGPFDFWRVEYGYRDFGAETPDDEVEELAKIASRSAEPLLAYATDHDVAGSYAIDPSVNTFDLGDDPLAYCEHKISLTKELWFSSLNDFEKDGTSFEKLRNVFQYGWRSYRESARIAARYVGGIYHNKSYIGDGDGNVPYTPVPKAKQKEAIALLSKHIFAADAFNMPAELLNKLQSPQKDSFRGIYGTRRDYPWHESVLNIQNTSLFTLYNSQTLGRLLNNTERYENDADMYTMFEMFTDVRNSIWSELEGPSNVNSYRRQLQLAHLNRLISIYLSSSNRYHIDARTLASNDLDIIKSKASSAAKGNVGGMTKAHYKEVVRQIEAAQSADRDFSAFGL